MRRLRLLVPCAMVLLAAACATAVAPALGRAPACAEQHQPGACSPLRHPV